jgi:hypothetical protein
MNRREQLIDQYLDGEELFLFLDPEYFDEAIIGVAQNAQGMIAIAYSEPKIIELLIRHDKMDPDEAVEWFQFNILGSYLGENTPLYIDDTILR